MSARLNALKHGSRQQLAYAHARKAALEALAHPDIVIENHGSVVLFRWHTDAGRDWLRDSVEDSAQYFGPALAVEPRYADALAEGASAAGLIIR